MKPKITYIQRALRFAGQLTLPDLSNSIGVAKARYIQSVYETPEYRNPDTLIRDLLPPLVRWLSMVQAKFQLSKLRRSPFYYYLIARTKHYDQVFTDTIDKGIKCIINIGCGTDTRAYRFGAELKIRGIRVLECDQAESIAIKQQLATRAWQNDHVTYVSLDLNDNAWPSLERELDKVPSAVLVMLEGVSPYIDEISFARFLSFLAAKLCPGSAVAYDYKMQGADDFEFDAPAKRQFRLPATKSDVIAYHEALGYKVEYLELSSELSSRLLPNLATVQTPLFAEDGLLRLLIPARKPQEGAGNLSEIGAPGARQWAGRS